MFTGIVEEIGTIRRVSRTGSGARISIHTSLTLKKGDSIAVDGVCLTVEELNNNEFTSFMSMETINRSHFSVNLKENLKVNLERAVTPSSSMGGHIVLGHVDSTGEIYSKELSPEGGIYIFRVHNPDYMKYVVEKGSIAVNGVSLTCFDVRDKTFKVSIIPFTLHNTTLGFLKEGDIINLEFDIIAKYVEKLAGRKSW
jgi:riboflavin synthase